MTIFSRTARFSLLAVSMTLVLSACNRIEDEAATPRSAGAPAQFDVNGLNTSQAEVGYVLGYELGSNLEPIKDEVDLRALLRGIGDSVDGKESKLTQEQGMQVLEALGQRVEARQQEEAASRLGENAEFLEGNASNPDVVTTASGLQYQILEEGGDGDSPTLGDVVRVNYEGSLLDGTVFDSSYQRGEPADIPLAYVVPGWQEALQMMSPGDKYKLWIPSELGYGESGTPGGPIPPNSVLVFEVELVEVLPAEQ